MRRTGLFLGLVALLLLWPAATAVADEPIVTFDGGQIFVDEDVSLATGQTFDGDLGVLRSDLTAEGGVVNGDLFITDGDAYIAGRVNGDLVIINGHLELTPGGHVTGDVFGLGASQNVAGQVEGNLAALLGDMALRSTALIHGDLLVSPGHLQRERGARVLGSEVTSLDMLHFPSLQRELETPGQIPPPPPIPWQRGLANPGSPPRQRPLVPPAIARKEELW